MIIHLNFKLGVINIPKKASLVKPFCMPNQKCSSDHYWSSNPTINVVLQLLVQILSIYFFKNYTFIFSSLFFMLFSIMSV